MPFQDPPTKRLHLVFPEHLLLQPVRFFGRCPRSFSCLMWRLLQCSDTFRFLADCPRDAPEVFGLVMAIPALLFLACLHIEFARVHLPVFRTHPPTLSTSPSVCFSHLKQPMVSSFQFREKNLEMFLLKKKIAPRPVVDAWGSNHHFLRPRLKARIGHPWRDQTRSCSPSRSILARSVLLQFLLHLRSRSRNKKPTKHQGHQSPQHGFSGTRVAAATVCLTPNRRVQNR